MEFPYVSQKKKIMKKGQIKDLYLLINYSLMLALLSFAKLMSNCGLVSMFQQN